MNETTKEYLKEHQLDDATMERWGIKVTGNAVHIPILDRHGNFLFYKTRHLVGDVKYTYQRGATAQLFGAHRITPETKDIYILEGELKAIAISEQYDYVAVSSTGGSRTWNSEWNVLLIDRNIHILYDNDKAGMDGAMALWHRLCLSGAPKSIEVLCLPDGYKDVNEVLDVLNDMPIEVVVPQSLSLLGLSDKKRKNMGVIRFALSVANEIEFGSISEKQRQYINIFREYAAKEYQKNRKIIPEKLGYEAKDLRDIKKIPITNFVRFENDLAPCLWHADRNPSMHFNGPNTSFPNTVKCYSCGKFADVIDVIMALNNVGFAEALKILRGE